MPFSSRSRASCLASVACLCTIAISGCDSAPPSVESAQGESPTYRATVVRTEFGIPHISANDWGSLGFGEAYAAAEDHVCNMALALVEARGESALAFGPGPQQANTARDIVVKALGIPDKAHDAFAAQPTDIQDWLRGYTAGYNQYLADKGIAEGSWCQGQDWVRPVEPSAFMAQYLSLVQTLPRVGGALVASTLPAAEFESTASRNEHPQTEVALSTPALESTLTDLSLRDMGSNAWALAGTRTENGRGLLLANPHYPWYGTARFWEKHLTIPGQYDAYGVGLIGLPGVAIGFNGQVGWSHTVSNSKRTVMYQLALNPEDPSQYRWGDEWRSLKPVPVTVAVKTDDSVESISHTLWFSHHGPLIALPGLSDNPYTAFAIRDANADNTQTLAQWRAMAQANGMDALIDAHRQYNAMPWVNTIAASADGRAVYLDNSTVGALSSETIANWQASVRANPRLEYLYLTRGLVILDGTTPAADWQVTDAPIPHTVPFDQRPLIESEQYVFNANDSYWLSDPDRPADAVSPLYGPTQSARSVRTRMNIELLRPDSPLGYAGADRKFSIADVQRALFGNDSLTATLLLPELLAACAENSVIQRVGGAVDVSEACAVLTRWDRKFDLDSRGAVLFREWLSRYPYTDTYVGNALFAEPFDPKAAGATPRGLAASDSALEKLADAVQLLTEANIPLDAPLGEQQTAHRMTERFPVHGGNRHEGIANLQLSAERHESGVQTPIFTGSRNYLGDSATLTESGYNVVHGSSFIMTLAFTDKGPEAEAILSYSQSGNPASAHFSDQTALYRDKQWRKIRFSPEAIAEAVISESVIESHF